MSYNGWSNYETWRVNLEVIDGGSVWDECIPYYKENGVGDDEALSMLADAMREHAEEVYFAGVEDRNPLACGLIASFLSAVNFYEIAKHYQ